MSFSSEAKKELCRLEASDACCARAELAAIALLCAAERKVVTENAAFARHMHSLLRRLCSSAPAVVIYKGKRKKMRASYVVALDAAFDGGGPLGAATPDGSHGACEPPSLQLADIAAAAAKRLTKSRCCKKTALRGAFLAFGSITDPEKLYHLEILCKDAEAARFIISLMGSFSIKPKVAARNEWHVVYIKDGEGIVKFLSVAGAHSALMALENVRIMKEMRNNVNRAVNCETANLDKTAQASVRQINSITYIRDCVGLDGLPPALREIAELRLENSDLGLAELGEMLTPPIGKSGANHRLRKLDAIAESIRGGRER
jgi:DNA-binding transcriptional regulator WhiA